MRCTRQCEKAEGYFGASALVWSWSCSAPFQALPRFDQRKHPQIHGRYLYPIDTSPRRQLHGCWWIPWQENRTFPKCSWHPMEMPWQGFANLWCRSWALRSYEHYPAVSVRYNMDWGYRLLQFGGRHPELTQDPKSGLSEGLNPIQVAYLCVSCHCNLNSWILQWLTPFDHFMFTQVLNYIREGGRGMDFDSYTRYSNTNTRESTTNDDGTTKQWYGHCLG